MSDILTFHWTGVRYAGPDLKGAICTSTYSAALLFQGMFKWLLSYTMPKST